MADMRRERIRVVCESCGETLRREPRQLGDPFEVYDDCPDNCGISPGEFMEWEDEDASWLI